LAKEFIQDEKKDTQLELQQFIEQHKTKEGIDGTSAATAFSSPESLAALKTELARLQEQHSLSNRSVTTHLLDAIFPPTMALDFAKNAKIIKLVIVDEKSRIGILEWIEERLNSGNALMEKKALSLAKFMYDTDMLAEDVFMKWEAQLPQSKTKTAFAPFFKWLKEADEED